MNLRSQLEGHGQQFTLAGWQALAVGDPQDGQPACVNSPGLDLTKQLYGIRQPVNSNGPVFVCEGVTDCWRIGTGAVAIFGTSLSEYQQLLLSHHFDDRPIVVVLDSNARAEAEEIQLQLQRARCRRVHVLDLP